MIGQQRRRGCAASAAGCTTGAKPLRVKAWASSECGRDVISSMRVRPRTVMPTSRALLAGRRRRRRRRARRAGDGCPRRRAVTGTRSALRPGLQLDGGAVGDLIVEVEVEHGGPQLAGVVRDDAHRHDAVAADDRRRDHLVDADVGLAALRRHGGVDAHLLGAQPGHLAAAVAARLVAVGEQQQAPLAVAREERHGAGDGAARGRWPCWRGRRGQRSIGAGGPGRAQQHRRRRRRSARRAHRPAPGGSAAR